MPTLISSKQVVARKDHACSVCGHGAITKGTPYQRDVYAYDGTVYAWLDCADCHALISEVYEWSGRPDEGVGQDDFVYWTDENGDDERAVAFLKRLYG